MVADGESSPFIPAGFNQFTTPMEKTSANPKRLRSKKGCRTCRIRRIKCDEHTPSCHKCSSTGRTCEWFEVFLDGSRKVKEQARARALEMRQKIKAPVPIAVSPITNPLESRGFEFFQLRTAQEMCPTFDFGFWKSLVLQLSQSDPAIRHAVIALGTLHEGEESLGMPISKDRLSSHSRHRFAVSQYNTSIKLLVKQTGRPLDATRAKISVLATCLIFIHIDLLRGFYESAVAHIRSALDIVGESTHPLPPSIHRMMKIAFRRLDLQSIHFNPQAPYSTVALGQDPLGIGFEQEFNAISEAKERYDTLLCHTSPLLRTCEANILKNQWHHLEDELLHIQQQDFLRLHEMFLHQCHKARKDVRFSDNRDQQALLLLQMHATLFRVFVSVCLSRDVESAYNNYKIQFAQIVISAKEFLSRHTCMGGQVSKLPTLSTDWGIVLPLTFTSMKCRDKGIREDALMLLESWKHREGFWDSELAATCCRQLMELEISGEGKSLDNPKQQATNVFVDFPDSQSDFTLTWEWSGDNSCTPPARDSRTMAM